MNYIVYDLVILAVLLLFAFWDLHKGLIRSLFSLLAVLVAFVGALLVSNTCAPAVAGWLQPMLQPTVTQAVQSALPEEAAGAQLPLDDLLMMLDETDLPVGLDKVLSDLQESGASVLNPESLAASLSEKLASAIACIALFLLSFLLILIVWALLSRTLDLVARLPGLHALNKLGGFVFGAVRGAVLLFVCAWLLQWSWTTSGSLIPGEAIEQTYLLNFFMTVNPLDYLAALS